MKTYSLLVASVAFLSTSGFSQEAAADQTVRCESRQYQYATCNIPEHGYVRLQRQTSKASCQQGRSWDYDRRHIWVDDGCAGEFLVETRYHTESHSDHKDEAAVAAIAGLAILAAAATANSNDKGNQQHQDRYNSDNYYHGGHSSYVPGWMTGRFSGYNTRAHKSVYMNISEDGRVRANVAGIDLQGYVNDERLYVGDLEFDIERAGDGFNTIEVGNYHNTVHYSRD